MEELIQLSEREEQKSLLYSSSEVTSWEAVLRLSESKRVYHDVESLSDFFCTTVKCVQTGFSFTFMIWPAGEINHIAEITYLYGKLSERRAEVISFNGVHYDSPMINCATDIVNLKEDPEVLCLKLKRFSDIIINTERWWVVELFKPYKYGHSWIDIDYFLYWSKQLRMSKSISLKAIGIQLHYPVVQELPVKHNEGIGDNVKLVVDYNAIHDIGILEYMATKKFNWQGKQSSFQEMEELRREAIQQFKLPMAAMHWDAVKLGLQVLLIKHGELNPGFDYRNPPPPYPFTEVRLKDILAQDILRFDDDGKVADKTMRDRKGSLIRGEGKVADSFGAVYRDMLTLSVSDTSAINYRIYKDGTMYDVKSGGLHSYHPKAEVIKPAPGYVYWDWDVASYYPSLAAVLDASPRHIPGLGKTMEWMKVLRLQMKHQGLGKTPRANLYKLAMNSSIGNYNQKNSPINDLSALLKITLNGQLELLMFCEWLLRIPGVTIDMCNTDGVTIMCPENQMTIVRETAKRWEEITGMELEDTMFAAVYRQHINSYLAIDTKGNVKEKGDFVTDPDLGNSCDFLIIPKAVQAYYTKGISPEDFLFGEDHDIFDFCASKKVGKQFQVMWGSDLMPQRLNRYYVSKSGRGLYKVKKTTGKKSVMPDLSGTAVQIYNEHLSDKAHDKDHDVDMSFYLKKINSVIREFEGSSQISLLFT